MRKTKKNKSPSRLQRTLTLGLLAVGVLVISSLIAALVVVNKESNPPQLQPAFANSTEAKSPERIELTVSIVCGGHVQCSKGIVPLRKSFKYLEANFNVSFKVKTVLLTSKQPVGTIEERWGEWFGIASEMGAAKNDLTVILVENYPDNVDTFDFKMEGVIGLATGIGVLGSPQPAGLIAKVMGSEQFMTRLLIHEIGHTLGAEHIEEGIMHPCACANQYADEFSIYSKQQIKEHLAKVRLYRMVMGTSKSEKKEEPKNTPASYSAPVSEKISEMCY